MKVIKFFFLAVFAGMMFASCNQMNCEDCNHGTPQVSNVTFTECNNEMPTNRADNNVVVVFTNAGVNITHYGLEVHCDFDTVLVTQNFHNGILNITEIGDPADARCLCYTDVSYTISGIFQNNVDSIVINGNVVWTAGQQNTPTFEGAWSGTFIDMCSSVWTLYVGKIIFSKNLYFGDGDRFEAPAFRSSGTFLVNGNTVTFTNTEFTPADWAQYYALVSEYTYRFNADTLYIERMNQNRAFVYKLTKQN